MITPDTPTSIARRTFLWMATAGTALLVACGEPVELPDPPVVHDINGVTRPVAAPGEIIEINGSGFLYVPGHVDFRQGGETVRVVPHPSGWSDTSVTVVVPDGETSALDPTLPVDVVVGTAGGDSGKLALQIRALPDLDPDVLTWTDASPLPQALRGTAAVAIPGQDGPGFLMVLGGNDGTDNHSEVWVRPLDDNGVPSGSWRTEVPLPEARAYHTALVIYGGNAPVDTEVAYAYVLGGQALAGEAPGGSDTVYYAAVSRKDGSIRQWLEAPALPVGFVGAAVSVYNGYLYLSGGLSRDGLPSATTYVARITMGGGLDEWVEQDELLSAARGFAAGFAHAGRLYVTGGDGGSRTDPDDHVNFGSSTVYVSEIKKGVVGPWDNGAGMKMRRTKHALWSFGTHVLACGGVYGVTGSLELEATSINEDDELDSWDQVDPVAVPGADVFNAAATLGPATDLQRPPALILAGGEKLEDPGTLSDAVRVGTWP